MQSDWTFLTSVITKETTQLMNSTNDKNILLWMYEDKSVEMDPHAHESIYIYPDVAKLLDSIGLPESKIAGGTIYNDYNGTNLWMNLVNGQYGSVFPNYFWEPDFLMGGGTPNHVNDLKYFGFWNPKDTANYLTHDSSSHLTHIGVGCEMKIRDTTTVSIMVNSLREIVNNAQSGLYPTNGFYIQTIFFSQSDLTNPVVYNKILQIADSLNVIIGEGNAEWKTLKQAYTLWESNYNSEVFQWQCGNIVNSEKNIITVYEIYPNPISDYLFIKSDSHITGINMYSILGQKIEQQYFLTQENIKIDLTNINSGIYIFEIHNDDGSMSYQKIVKK